MGLETTTFISGFTTSWPLAGDTKSQGDDHIRLIKAALQSTFPSANRAFYFPKIEIAAATLTLDITDQNNTIILDTTAGNVAITLPSLAAADAGWECKILNGGNPFGSNAFNAAIVYPASGVIHSRAGGTATIRVGQYYEPATFVWRGGLWYCYKPGPMIGSVESFDGVNTPAGYLDSEGATYSNTDYAELFAVLATTTLRDRRGRTDIGSGTGTGLTARTVGTNYGAETVTLVTGNLPAYTPAGSLTAITSTATAGASTGFAGGGATQALVSKDTGNQGNTSTGIIVVTTGSFTGTAQGGTSTAVANVQPSIGVKKIIRAC